VVSIGAAAKCAPPLRAENVRADMISRVKRGEVDTLGTDHSPCPPEMKETGDFFKVWGGIAGAQSFLPALWAVGLDAATIGRLAASQVASRFGLSGRKGAIAPGLDADLVLIDPRGVRTLRREDLLMRHAVSPYLGREFPASIESVWVRGTPAWSRTGGRGAARGRLVRPEA